MRVIAGAETQEYVVTGGFAEVSPTATTILAEQAVPRREVDAAMLSALLNEAERELADAPGGAAHGRRPARPRRDGPDLAAGALSGG